MIVLSGSRHTVFLSSRTKLRSLTASYFVRDSFFPRLEVIRQYKFVIYEVKYSILTIGCMSTPYEISIPVPNLYKKKLRGGFEQKQTLNDTLCRISYGVNCSRFSLLILHTIYGILYS